MSTSSNINSGPETLFDTSMYEKEHETRTPEGAELLTETENQPAPVIQSEAYSEPIQTEIDPTSQNEPSSDTTPQTNQRKVVAVAGGLVASGLLAIGILGMAGQESDKETEPIMAIDEAEAKNQAAEENEAMEGSILSPSTSEVAESPKDEAGRPLLPDGYVYVGDDFVVPELGPQPIENLPTIKETNELDEVFKQIGDVLTYVANTGDISALKYAISDVDASGAHHFKTLPLMTDYIREQVVDDYFYNLVRITSPDNQDATLDPSQGVAEIQSVEYVEMGFEVVGEGPEFEKLFRHPYFELRHKTVEVNGAPKNIWVLKQIETAEYEEIFDYSGILGAVESHREMFANR